MASGARTIPSAYRTTGVPTSPSASWLTSTSARTRKTTHIGSGSHHDDSILVRYFNRPQSAGISKMAFTLNSHFGTQWDGVNPFPGRKSYMLGSALANRIWFSHDHLAWSFRAEGVTNPSHYLALLPTPDGFPPGPDNYSLKLWDLTSTIDVLPTDSLAFRFEFFSRHSNVPYFAGRGGTTSRDGWQGTSGSFIPDLAKHENRLTFAINWRM